MPVRAVPILKVTVPNLVGVCDLSEGGMLSHQIASQEGDVISIEAHELFELMGVSEQTLRARWCMCAIQAIFV